MVFFSGRYYGGMHGSSSTLDTECRSIIANLDQKGYLIGKILTKMKVFDQCPPQSGEIQDLFSIFKTHKFWLVWASKFFHLIRPDVFPILDSNAEKALGLSWGVRSNELQRYTTFLEQFGHLYAQTRYSLTQILDHDRDPAPSRIKILDKVLYEIGRAGQIVK